MTSSSQTIKNKESKYGLKTNTKLQQYDLNLSMTQAEMTITTSTLVVIFCVSLLPIRMR